MVPRPVQWKKVWVYKDERLPNTPSLAWLLYRHDPTPLSQGPHSEVEGRVESSFCVAVSAGVRSQFWGGRSERNPVCGCHMEQQGGAPGQFLRSLPLLSPSLPGTHFPSLRSIWQYRPCLPPH